LSYLARSYSKSLRPLKLWNKGLSTVSWKYKKFSITADEKNTGMHLYSLSKSVISYYSLSSSVIRPGHPIH
jgi:hypothetical protein